ncbi:PAS domain S-box protein [Pseudomonas sp. LS44]|uniref:PAS domain S-box protein n=1 Tax=Pseudomonas sp. LS44 TaxID=1357074 RepID=UPI00215A3F6C|nr:PAS domain S-box protein [Pseudomonas sp. LS44]UVE19643.1 PAS domain S-box protein [Pseudomonas sp. LS44]
MKSDSLLSDDSRYRFLVNAVHDYAIYMIDPVGIVVSWNRGAQRFKGYTEDEVLGQSFSNFYTPEDRASGLPQLNLEISAREGWFKSEGWRVRKDGTRFWASVVIDPIRNPKGTLLGFAKVTRDISEAKAAQEALEQARSALFQSQKMEAIGQLTGGIAHDFNNLLMAVLGNLELLAKRLPADPKLQRLVDNAIAGAQRGASLTQRMLTFSRRQRLLPQVIEVQGMIRAMTELLNSFAPVITFETRLPLSLDPIKGDMSQLELAVINLAMNVRDVMPNGGNIVITATNQVVEPNDPRHLTQGRYVCLSVTDTGEGMDELTLQRAVEPFFTTKSIGKGTGLGLSIVHGLAEQLGGKLILRSQKGIGTTAELWLPSAQGEEVVGTGESRAPQVADSPFHYKVLLVDDDALVMASTVAMLEDLGCDVVTANSGDQALDLLESQIPDLLISDHAMPGMTGLQLIAAVHGQWPKLPVILATGFAEELHAASSSLPMLSKPYRQSDLAQAITGLMRSGS